MSSQPEHRHTTVRTDEEHEHGASIQVRHSFCPHRSPQEASCPVRTFLMLSRLVWLSAVRNSQLDLILGAARAFPSVFVSQNEKR